MKSLLNSVAASFRSFPMLTFRYDISNPNKFSIRIAWIELFQPTGYAGMIPIANLLRQDEKE